MSQGGADSEVYTVPAWMARRAEIQTLLAQYPDQRSGILPLLHLAQAERGFVHQDDFIAIADLLEVPVAYVKSVCSFYAMYHRHPVGRYFLVLCGNLSCGLCGSQPVLKKLEAVLGVPAGGTTPDGLFTLEATSECLAACDAGPVLQVNVEYALRLSPDKVERLITALRQRDRETLADLMEAGAGAADELLRA